MLNVNIVDYYNLSVIVTCYLCVQGKTSKNNNDRWQLTIYCVAGKL